jgi:membrane protease YdiL (CAAX protease family)
MFKRPVFWIVFVFVCLASTFFAYSYFDRAFPIVSVDIQMDREAALQSARDLAARFGWGPDEYHQAASFGQVPGVQEFIELEGGGPDAFREMLAQGTFHSYRWTVRHFRQMERVETRVVFTPAGEPYGFRVILPEDAPGAALEPEVAREQAELVAASEWGIDFPDYQRVETSQEERPSGRIDHTFVYEHQGIEFGEGRLRLRLVVSGSQLTELTRFIEIPEAFTRRFDEMRSTNMLIGVLSNVAIFLGYVLVGCLVALFFLHRERWVIWKKPVIWGMSIAALQGLLIFNQLPLSWMGYDTALSTTNFLLQQLGIALLTFVGMGLLLSVSFMAAESMTRRAFPQMVQFWRVWSPGVANSPSVAGQTMTGFLMVGVFLGYQVLLYLFANNVLGWWTPADATVQPDLLATYFPWLTAIAISLQAGFWEECLFRAVPIAGAALLGKKYGNQRLWIIGAFVVQALVFGAGHAPYPTMPAYARVVELIIPSIIFGLLYLYFGLLPAIVMHYAFDAVLIGMPLFVMSAPGIWFDRVMLVLLTLVPLGVVLGARLRAGAWVSVAVDDRNAAWEPAPEVEKVEVEAAPITGGMAATARRLIPVAGVVGLVLWLVFAGFASDAPVLEVGRSEVEAVSQRALDERGIELPPPWRQITSVVAPLDVEHRFIWQEGGPEIYQQLLGTYLKPPYWEARYVRFEGDIVERAEEFRLSVYPDGSMQRFWHRLPEARPGADLSEAEARSIAATAVRDQLGLTLATVAMESTVETETPVANDAAAGGESDPTPGTESEPAPGGEPDSATGMEPQPAAGAEPERAPAVQTGPGLREISAESEKHPDRRDWTFTFEDEDGYPLEQGAARVHVRIAGDQVADVSRYVHVPEEWEREDRNRQVLPGVLGIVGIIVVVLGLIAGVVVGVISWTRKKFSVAAFLLAFAVLLLSSILTTVNNWPTLLSQLDTSQPFLFQVIILLAGMAIAFGLIAVVVGIVVGWVQRMQLDSGPQSLTLAQSLIVGASLAALVAGLRALAGSFGAAQAPEWASLGDASAYVPVLGVALSPLFPSLITPAAFLLLAFTAIGHWTRGWTRLQGPFYAVLFALGWLLGGSAAGGVTGWIVSGALSGILLLILYPAVLRYDYTVIPVGVATLAILAQARQVAMAAYPGVVPGGILAIIVLAAAGVFWTMKLRRVGPAAG